MSTETSTPIDEKDARRAKLLADLPRFTGTEHLYKHPLFGLTFTDGMKFVADTAEAYWLLDVIASYQGELRKKVSAITKEKGIPFQIWRLEVNFKTALQTAVVTCHEDWDEDNHAAHPAIIRQDLPYTDFPLAEFMCYCTDNIILLPGEY